MGWWGSDILGGDTPLDAVGELEKAIGWDYEKRGGFIYQLDKAEQAHKTLTTKSNWAKVQRLIRKMSKTKYDMSSGAVLAVIYVLVNAHVKLTDEIAKIARDAIGLDEWGREGDQSRLDVLEDFRIKVEAATTGKPPKKRKFSVTLEREIKLEGTFEVEAISPKDAVQAAKKLAADAEVLPGDGRFKYPRQKNVLFKARERWVDFSMSVNEMEPAK